MRLPHDTRGECRHSPPLREAPHPSGHLTPPTHRAEWGFGSIRRPTTACRRRVAPLMLQFPLLTREGTTAAPPSAPPSALAGTSDAPPAQRLHFPGHSLGPVSRPPPRRKLWTPPAIQSKRNQINSTHSNCHKPILNALEFMHEPRRWGHRSPLHPRNC